MDGQLVVSRENEWRGCRDKQRPDLECYTKLFEFYFYITHWCLTTNLYAVKIPLVRMWRVDWRAWRENESNQLENGYNSLKLEMRGVWIEVIMVGIRRWLSWRGKFKTMSSYKLGSKMYDQLYDAQFHLPRQGMQNKGMGEGVQL